MLKTTNQNLKEYSIVKPSSALFIIVKWACWTFFIASILLLTYVYFRAEISFQGNKNAHYLKYYAFSILGIIFWGFVLRLNQSIQTTIVTIASSIVIGLYLVELILTFFAFDQSQKRLEAAKELGIEYDQRTKLEVIDSLIAEGIDTVPVIHVANLLEVIGTNKEDINQLFPLGGISNKTTVYGNESGEYLIYKSDRYGFHNPDSQWDFQTIEWLLTGDSFAHGANVKPGQEIAAQLRSISDNSAISLGIGGNGPLLEYAALIEYGKILKPKKVLWVYFEGNDLTSNLKIEKSNPLLMQYMKDGFTQNLINRQEEIDSSLEKYIMKEKMRAEKQPLLSNHLWIRLHLVRKLLGVDLEFDIPLFSKILTKAKAEVEAWGGEIYFVYLPEYNRYSSPVLSHDQYKRKSEIKKTLKSLDIPVVDIHQEVFFSHPDKLALFPLRIPGHYNADGYSRVANAIIKAINNFDHSEN